MATESLNWLDASYVQRILRNAEGDETIEVSDVTVKEATAKGDNYSSDMHRVAVKYSRVQSGHEIQENRSFILKVMPQGGMREQMLEGTGIFETELSMMSVTLPKMNEILNKLGSTSLGAQCLHIQYEKPTHIVMEDLAPKGFRMADRRAGLDLDHSILAIKNLARFHAASIALKEKDSEAFANYKEGMLHKGQPEMIRGFFNSGAKALAKEAAKWPELSPRIKEKLLKLSDVLFEKASDVVLCQEDDFQVLNHGDFWVNNMLFRYDEQRKPIDHIFVDFQICHYGSPVSDLLYFFGTSPTDDVRLHHRKLLEHEYYSLLASTMVKLNCETEVLSLEELQEELKKKRLWEVLASMTILPFVVLEKDEEINLDEVLGSDEEYKNPGYAGKTYRKIMTRLLPWYDSMGLLDA